MRLFRCPACDRIWKLDDAMLPEHVLAGRCACGARYTRDEVERIAVPFRPLPEGLDIDLCKPGAGGPP